MAVETILQTEVQERILVVDDDRFIRLTFQDALVKAGFLVDVASDGASALDSMKRQLHDLVLLDLMMPGISGFETCQEIRGIPGYEHVPIVMVTTLSDSASIAEAFDAGATDFIVKPINHELLVNRIRYMLRASRNMAEARLAKDRIRMLKEAFDCLPIGIGITISDTTGMIVYANSREADMHGYTQDELLSMHAGQLAPERYRNPICPDEVRNIGLWERECVNVRKNGEEFPVRLSSMAVKNSNGKCIGVVTACEDITSKKESERRIHQLAYYDTLTELPNRVTLLERLRKALSLAKRGGKFVAVLFLDLDNFKDVNDTMGHNRGDRMLREVARRLVREVRDTDTVARIGGDEFVIVLSVAEREEIPVAAERIMSVFSRPVVLGDLQMYSSASIGIAIYPDDGVDADTLLQCADAAMYHAKGEGRSLYRFFCDDIERKVKRRVALGRALREGIERREFYLHYQPQWDLHTGKMVGVEALLRWTNEEFGPVPPSELISVAEMSGMIVELEKWVLRTGCIQARKWERAGFGNLRIAVNISAKHFRQPDFLDSLREIIIATGVDPRNVELEFTESVIMEKADSNIITLKSLKEMGILLSVDDFGTGYSSLNYLKHFPIDRIKIDRSFVTDVTSDNDDAAIVEAIITMAHSLRLKVLAEGVENHGQMSYLTRRNCDEIQGFYLAKPMPAEAVTDLLFVSCGSHRSLTHAAAPAAGYAFPAASAGQS